MYIHSELRRLGFLRLLFAYAEFKKTAQLRVHLLLSSILTPPLSLFFVSTKSCDQKRKDKKIKIDRSLLVDDHQSIKNQIKSNHKYFCFFFYFYFRSFDLKKYFINDFLQVLLKLKRK